MRMIQGDLLDYGETHLICHQCNCVTPRPKGLAAAIFAKYPSANTYGSKRMPGTIDIIGPVVNMYAQITPSRAKTGRDSAAARLEYFASCLRQLDEHADAAAKFAFPFKIGCGLAGGDWRDYFDLISEFARRREVIIVKLKPACASGEAG